MICRLLEQAAEPAWDRFVAASPNGTFFHRAAWRHVLERTFGHRTHYVFAEKDGAITGVLPLVHVKSRLFGNKLVSTPFCVYGGPLAADPDSEAALRSHAVSLMRSVGAKVIEFRFGGTSDGSNPDWRVRSDLYFTFRRPIAATDAENLSAIPRKQRAMVRKGIGQGLTSCTISDADTLHGIYAESVRNLGTPVFPRRYFRILLDVFRDSADVVVIRDRETPVAAVMNFYHRDEVLPYYGGGTAAARRCHGNDFLYWEVMRRARIRGSRLFDFGRSKFGTGSFDFKKNWGFSPTPLHYCYHLAAGEAVPDVNPLNPKYRLFIKAWKRLPLPVANLVGPHIVRGIG